MIATETQPISLESALSCLASKPALTNAEVDAYDWRHSIAPRLALAGWEDRFRRRITDWRRSAQEKAFRLCLSKLQNAGAIIVLTGIRGTGKTTIASQIAVERTLEWWEWACARTSAPRRGIPEYRKLTDVVSRLKPLYADFGSIDSDRLVLARGELCSTSLLCVDEIHECEEQRMKDRILTDVIDRRYAKRLDSLLISNQTIADFNETTNPSILSRIKEHGAIVQCTWESWR